MIKREIINEAIDYIISHLQENITVEDVANHCHFSKYHFSRIFKQETGESVYAFIKRNRLENSAIFIKAHKGHSITDIAMEYGYSSSNYSSAFKQLNLPSPVTFRSSKETPTTFVHPCFPEKTYKLLSKEDYNKNITIKTFPDFSVIYERFIGPYDDLAPLWNNFSDKYKDYCSKNSMFIERSYSDPSITKDSQCICDICLYTDIPHNFKNVTTICGGTYACYHLVGKISDIYGTYQGLYTVWLPSTKYMLDHRNTFDICQECNPVTQNIITDICIPIKER